MTWWGSSRLLAERQELRGRMAFLKRCNDKTGDIGHGSNCPAQTVCLLPGSLIHFMTFLLHPTAQGLQKGCKAAPGSCQQRYTGGGGVLPSPRFHPEDQREFCLQGGLSSSPQTKASRKDASLPLKVVSREQFCHQRNPLWKSFLTALQGRPVLQRMQADEAKRAMVMRSSMIPKAWKDKPLVPVTD